MVRAKVMIWAVAAAMGLSALPAHASIASTFSGFLDSFARIAHPDAVAPRESGIRLPPQTVKAADETTLKQPILAKFGLPALPSMAMAQLPEPSVETPLHKFFCAEYARARSGLALFGDAKYWWGRARSLYTRARKPVENAVMVFKVTDRLKLGHVAVVTHIVSSREIRVDQANWQNHGEIDHATPIRDVSPKNDWSQVRVWDLKSQQYGRVYPVSGFILQRLTREAMNTAPFRDALSE